MASMAPAGRLAILVAAALTAIALGQGSCQGRWLSGAFSTAGVGGSVYDSCIFDDGSGPALYVTGLFSSAGGQPANGVARFDGTSWSALGAGLSGAAGVAGTGRALAVFDDGTGPALYVGGTFMSAGGVAASNIAKWNGTSWSPVGTGLSGISLGSSAPAGVHDLAVHDDGSGLALYAGGSFTMAGGIGVSNVAKWNGSALFPCGAGLSHTVRALRSFDPGGGTMLFAGGDFNATGVTAAGRLAAWTGASWLPVGSGVAIVSIPFNNARVYALAVHDDGSGPALYVGGFFEVAGGVPASNVARYAGGTWSAVGAGSPSFVWALATYDDGTSPALVAASALPFTTPVQSRLDKWDGASWAALTSPVLGTIESLLAVNVGPPDILVVGGGFTIPGGASGIAVWTGGWIPLGAGTGGVNGTVHALAQFDDGTGPALYVGGGFTSAGGLTAASIARWSPTNGWANAGGFGNGGVRALVVHYAGAGPELYAGGLFNFFNPVTGLQVRGVARWTANGWVQVGGGIIGNASTTGTVLALASFDDGSGPALYAAGDFAVAGGFPISNVAKWNGSAWSALGTGTNGPVNALAVHDDGTGPALYAGGVFGLAGGTAAFRIAKWSGGAWTALGFGLNLPVRALASFDDGSGPALYAGGSFQDSGGQSMTQIARWNGAAWSPVGGGMSGPSPGNDGVFVLRVHDDGSGPALWAGGWFNMAGGAAASNLARWNGAAWSSIGGGANGQVRALAPLDLGTVIAMTAGGDFITTGGVAAERVGAWTTPRPAILFAQPGPGAGVTVTSANLTPGREYFDVFSFEPAPGGLGTGPYLGLHASNVSTLLAQFLMPLGSPPFHFVAATPTMTFGPFPAPPGLVVEAVSFDFTGGLLGCVSPVRTITVQ
jgi:hypothetical protein